MRKLTHNDYRLIELAYRDGWAVDRIADQFRIDPSYVRRLLARIEREKAAERKGRELCGMAG